MIITFPWAVLVPDNERHMIMNKRRRIILTPRYRECLAAASALATTQSKHVMFTSPVVLEVQFIEPDRQRRDISNYSKLVHDALSGAAYKDDSLIDDVRWFRGGINPVNPRCEITIIPIGDK